MTVVADRPDHHHSEAPPLAPTPGAPVTALDDLPITPTTTTVRAACPHDCPDTCAMLVTVEDGRATKVARRPGAPVHPRRAVREGQQLPATRSTAPTACCTRCGAPGRRAAAGSSGSPGTRRWTRSPTRFRATIAEHGPETVMPVSYLGTQGILNGLNVGDAFFNKLGATITERTYCDSGSCTAYVMTIGATAGVDPESLVHSPLHHHLGVQHDLDEPAPVAVHRRGPEARREGRRASTRCATAPRSAPTGTSRSGPAPTARSRWR